MATVPVFNIRTQDEVVARMHETRKSDMLGFTAEVLAPYLDVDRVRPFCKPEADLADWKASPLTRESILDEMKDYMSFAWEKAINHRGISASRSVEKMRAWLWLLGDDEAVTFAADDDHYPQYGAPVLLYICERYGFDVPDDEDARRMAKGQRCTATYDCGCGY